MTTLARENGPPRLRNVKAIQFGAHVQRLILQHVNRLLEAKLPPMKTSRVAVQAARLAMYAQGGLAASIRWTDHAEASRALLEVCKALYSCAGRPDGHLAAVDPTEVVDVVLLAAHARIRIANDATVSVREIACLANVDPQYVRQLGRSGELAVENGVVQAVECRRWLGARGVVV